MTNNQLVQVLKNVNFRSLWLAQITSQIALNMLIFILALQIYSLSRSNALVSTLIVSVSLPAIIVGVLAGVYVDRLDKRKVMLVANAARVFVVLAFLSFPGNLAVIFILAFLMSAVSQFFVPAEAPSIPRLVGKDLLVSANSLFNFSFYGSTISGFLTAGPILNLFGQKNVFIFLAFLYLLAFVFILKLPPLLPSSKNRHQSIFQIKTDLLECLRFIKDKKSIWQAILILTGSQAVVTVLMALAPGLADRFLEIDVVDASVYLLGPAALGIILASLFLSLGFGRDGKKLVKKGILFIGINLLLIALFYFVKQKELWPFWPVYLFLFGLGVGVGLVAISANTTLQAQTKDELRGRIYGVITAALAGAAILPVALGGFLADVIGIGWVMMILGGLVLLLAY